MAITDTSEKKFESDIESFFLSEKGGYTKCTATYDKKYGIYPDVLIGFIKDTQPKAWAKFSHLNAADPEKSFCIAFDNATKANGVLDVLRHGFKTKGVTFKVCAFMPESTLNDTDTANYKKNVLQCCRQWYYSDKNKNSVDMILTVNGIPVFAFELKNQFKGQSVQNAIHQWKTDRNPKEVPFIFNNRVLAFFAVDLNEVWMATKLDGDKTYFLPFNQGSAGAGNDGGKGNPDNPNGYPTAYLWEKVFQADSMMDIIQKFISLQGKVLIFPRYHQLDVVRKLIDDVKKNGTGRNYLIQHSAGSGKSNSIAWTAYRLASLHDDNNNPVFNSVIVVTDRTVLDAQLQATISGFDHTLGTVETIDKESGKTSQDLKTALNNGKRIIVTTLQKFPVIYDEVDDAKGRHFAVICDEAHSSQTGNSAQKLKVALADVEDALKEYDEFVDDDADDISPELKKQLVSQGKHKNLSFFAFTATPKDTTLQMFGTRADDGSYHPFHIYSMRQAIEEGFILDVLQNYMTYKTCFEIVNKTEENPDVPSRHASKVIKKYLQLHPENIRQKSEVIVEIFRNTTRGKIGGKAKMMVVTSSRLAAVQYFHEVKRYAEEKKYTDVKPMVAFSGEVEIAGVTYTESSLNTRDNGSHISENQTKQEFHDNFNMLIVAEKYQTGFDEPLLHTMIVDKKLRGVKTVQTLSRLNRTCKGKNDTFILDFANEKEDIKEDFQLFYHETYLEEEINVDLVYTVIDKIHEYNLYDENDIDNFCETYFANGAQDETAQGILVSKLQPVISKYMEKDDSEKYEIRRLMRNFCKWYSYISQIIRMFDDATHKEFVFCSFLSKLLPATKVEMEDIEDMLSLTKYKLEKTFEGDINLDGEKGVYEPAKPKGPGSDESKDPLNEIIEKINETYAGEFTEADRYILGALAEKLRNNDSLESLAKTSDKKIFIEGMFSKVFDKAAMESYKESEETYSTLFNDKAKYNAFMKALADVLYKEMRSGKKKS